MTNTATASGFATATDPARVAAGISLPDDAPVAPDRRRRSVIDIAGPLAVLGLFVGYWYFLSYWGLQHLFKKPRFLVPPPHEVFHESFLVWSHFHPMLDALLLSTRVALTGLFIAIVIGMILAIAMSQAKWVERSLWPYLVALQAVPILAFVPLIGNILGFELRSRVIVCVIIAIFPITANTLFGLLSAERAQHDLFTLQGANRLTRLRKLQLPAAMPAIFAGFRISAGLSVIGAVVGDFFFRQGDSGIGILIDVYRARLNNPLMYGAVLLAALLGIVVFILFGWIGQRVTGHWYESTRKST